MNSLMICLAAVFGFDVGWERLPDGGVEYIIQLDPQALKLLQAGETFQSHVPPAAGEIRSYRIVVGRAKLPRDEPPPTASSTIAPPTAALPFVATETSETPQPPPVSPNKIPKETKLEKPELPETLASDAETGSNRPWWALTLTMLALFASIGANGYLGWIAWDARRRFFALCAAGNTPR